LIYWLQKLTARISDRKISKDEEQIQPMCGLPRISPQPPKATEAGGKVKYLPYCHEKVSNALFEIFVINTDFPASGSNAATILRPATTSSALKPAVFAFGGSGQNPACLIGRGTPS